MDMAEIRTKLEGAILAVRDPKQAHRKETSMNHRSSSSSPDVIGFLKSQHEQIKGLFEQVLTAKGPARKECFITLKTLMAAHEVAEEKIVRPAAKRAIAGGRAEVSARLHEEDDAKKALAALEKLDVGSKEFESELRSLQKAVLSHAHSEETEEFGKLAEKLDTNKLHAMREQAEDGGAGIGGHGNPLRSVMSRRMSRRLFLGASASLSLGACRAQHGPTSSTAPQEGQVPLPPPSATTAEMPTRLLGKTGVTVSRVGLGGAHIGKQSDEQESIRIVRSAIDRGLTFMDNAWDYNEGHSEERMGKALRDGYRQRAFLMTKLDGRTKPSAAAQLEQSLRRLQTDMIDLSRSTRSSASKTRRGSLAPEAPSRPSSMRRRRESCASSASPATRIPRSTWRC
jgi:hypothetical protein